jgi:putative transposase
LRALASRQAGPVAVRCPRVRDRAADGGERIRFSSAILPPYARRSKSLEVLIPILYLKGVSTGDFEEALVALLGKDAGGLSASTIGRLKEAWSDEHARWSKRDLSAKPYNVQARLEDEAQCLLVIIGATPEGKKELVGLIDGVRESSQSWKGLLLDLKRRGLSMGPELAVADGALGFWQALEEVWPNTRGQRCWVHKTANVLNKLPKSQQFKAKRALQEIWMAETKKDALAAFDTFIETWGVKYDKAVECLIKDRAALLSFYDFPAEHIVRDDPPPHGAFQGMSFQQDSARHDLQAGRGRGKKLTPSRWSQPVPQGHPWGKVRRRNRSSQTASSTRCRLTLTITNFRR